MYCKLFLNCLICSLGQHFTYIKGSKYMLVHSLASKYLRFVVIVRQMYWTPPSDHWTPSPLKSDDFFLGNQEILDPPLSKILDTPLFGQFQALCCAVKSGHICHSIMTLFQGPGFKSWLRYYYMVFLKYASILSPVKVLPTRLTMPDISLYYQKQLKM